MAKIIYEKDENSHSSKTDTLWHISYSTIHVVTSIFIGILITIYTSATSALGIIGVIIAAINLSCGVIGFIGTLCEMD